MNKELEQIVNNLDLTQFKIKLDDKGINSGFYLYFIRVENFDNLFEKYHNSFNDTKNIAKQKLILSKEKEVYEELVKYLKKLISGIKSTKIQIKLTYERKYYDLIENTLDNIFNLKKTLLFNEKIKQVVLKKLNLQLNESEEYLFKIKNYEFATYTNEEFLGSNFYLRFPKELIIYKDVSIGKSGPGYSVLTKDNSKNDDKINLLNILAFIQAVPNFILTVNPAYNAKLTSIYNEFDILDLLTISSTKFFNLTKSKFRSLSTPIFKLHKNKNITIIPDCKNLELFHLYHSSLKQFEPLPRCVFLFRIIEYGKNYHYQKIFNSPNIKLTDVIEYYYNQILEHKFIPLYFLDYGNEWDKKNREYVQKRKTQYLNLFTELKKKAKQIKNNKWKIHPFLKNMSFGEIVYNTGRNSVAHGSNGIHNTNYDYSSKYVHINDVNVFLELIARYLIEIHNPGLKKILHKQKKIYELNCSHMQMMKNGGPKVYEL